MGAALQLSMIRRHWQTYDEARRYLASNHTTVAKRKEAIAIKEDFGSCAPAYVADLVEALDELIAWTDGEECSDPDGCGVHWQCCRCRLRNLGGGK